jgi:hypothetical protein
MTTVAAFSASQTILRPTLAAMAASNSACRKIAPVPICSASISKFGWVKVPPVAAEAGG